MTVDLLFLLLFASSSMDMRRKQNNSDQYCLWKLQAPSEIVVLACYDHCITTLNLLLPAMTTIVCLLSVIFMMFHHGQRRE
jgi:hypothetical protein